MLTKTKPAKSKTEWKKIRELYYQALDEWLGDQDRRAATKIARQLRPLLRHADKEAILGQECWSLIQEIEGDIEQAIRHRENEIALIKRLWQAVSKDPGSKAALDGYGPADLSDRMDLLAALYYEHGELEKAITTLRASRRLCRDNNIPFDGGIMLTEFLAEQRHAKNSGNGRALVKR